MGASNYQTQSTPRHGDGIAMYKDDQVIDTWIEEFTTELASDLSHDTALSSGCTTSPTT
jgi:hypothetical protein